MSLFLTGHLVQTIADTVKSGQDFLELAVHHYQKALELLPGKTVIARNLALSYRTLHRYQEALTIYEGMLQASPSDLPVMNEAAKTSTFLGDEQKAMRLYRTVLERDSCSLDGLNGIGYLYLQHLEYTKAIQTFQQAVKCVPSSAYAAYYLGESMARSGLVEEARDSWERSLNRVTIRTVQEKEFFHRMQERILGIPALLSHASPISMTGNPQIQ
jgi:tetratricopeptide (TPR) repeat protein